MFPLGRIALLTLCVHPLFGGLVLDGSLGTSGALPGPNYMIGATLGRQVGTNLFHSFSQFDLISSESATFSGPSNIQNILARVTSGSASSIDGTVRSDIAGANLFLLNPAGVIFGAHAQIDVSGSFAVSTANYVKLADGGRFNTSLGGQDMLTSAPVTAFGFLSPAPAAVSVTGSTLNIAPAKSFSVVAGDIAIDAGKITGAGSRVNLVSVQSAGEAQLDATSIASAIDVTQFTTFGEIDLTNLAQLSVSGPQGGAVVIRGEKLSLNNSQITSQTTGSLDGLPLDIALSGELDIINRAFIFTNALAGANGGNLNLHAGSLLIDGSASPELFTGIALQTSGEATGGAGNLAITVDDALSIVGHGTISTNTLSSGRGGNLSIHAGSLLIDGSATPDQFTGIASDSNPGATGDAGSLALTVDNALTIVSRGEIVSGTFSSGKGGNLTISAGSLSIDGSFTPGLFTGISSGSNPGATGDAGDLTINVNAALTVAGAGEISVDTFSSGNGGNATIHAGSLVIDAAAAPGFTTGVIADTLEGTGNAGELTVLVDRLLTIRGSGEISADTNTSGKGGNLNIQAGSLSIDGSATPDFFTGISADAADGTGNAGDLTIVVTDALSVTGSGQISADTYTSGKGGNLNIQAGSLSIDGATTPEQITGIFADSNPGATGDAGDLTITVSQALSVSGSGQITGDTYSSGKGGNLVIQAGSLSIDGSATPDFFTGISADAADGTGNAGDLTIVVTDALSVTGSGQISADTYTSGKGGNLNIQAGSLSIDGATTPEQFTGIFADSNPGATGDAGDLTITVSQALSVSGGGQISADTYTSGRGGNLSIQAGSLVLDGSASNISVGAIEGTGNGGDLTVAVNGLLTIGKGASIATDTSTSGNAGDVIVQTGDLSITGGGEISSNTFSLGDGGNVTVSANSILIDGMGAGPNLQTGIFADTGIGSSGNAGNVTVNAGDLKIVGLASVSTATEGDGNGGLVTVKADSILIDGTGFLSTGLGGGIEASAPLGHGNAGDVIVQTGDLQLINGGTISTSTDGFGNGGDIFVTAQSILIKGRGSESIFPAGILAEASDVFSDKGRGGDVTINADSIVLQDGGTISAKSHFGGQAGSIELNLGTLSMDSGSIISSAAVGTGNAGSVLINATESTTLSGDSSISTSALSGPAGSVSLTTGTLEMDSNSSISSANAGTGSAGSVFVRTTASMELSGGSSISTSSSAGDAGSIELSSNGIIRLLEGSSITASAGANGGSIHLNTPDLIYLTDSSITATAGSNGGGGTGGNITIDDPQFIILKDSLISANATIGQGGDINLISDFFFNSDSLISATGATNGTINITAPELDLGATLITLPSSLLSAETQLRERCTAQLRGDFSSFITLGRGGTEPAPDELQITF